MADARFDISIEAENVGVDATSDQLNTLVDRMTKANTVATKFDTVVAAARARLDETAVAASAAAQALQLGEMRYRELEGAALLLAWQSVSEVLAGLAIVRARFDAGRVEGEREAVNRADDLRRHGGHRDHAPVAMPARNSRSATS